MAAAKGNKYAVGNNGGRPPLYETPEQLSQACDEYFEYIKGEFHIETIETDKGPKKEKVWDRYPEPATVTGLALFLGFAHRSSLDDYEAKEEFSNIIKRARSIVEHNYEKGLQSTSVTGAIFALKNMGWKDKSEVDSNTNLIVNWPEERTYEANV